MFRNGTADPEVLRAEAADIGYLNNDGLLIENTITDHWVTTHLFSGILPRSHYRDSPSAECPRHCTIYGSQYQDLDPLYIPFRWYTDDAPNDYYYGWAAFEVVTLPEVFTCNYWGDPDTGCPPFQGTYQTNQFRWVAAGYETEPNTPIIAGGGLCPGDINYDTQRDIFDVFDYLDLFNTMDAAADYDNDGTLDVFDVFAFLDDFQSPCEF